MNVGYLLLGVALLAVAIVDLLWTTLWVEGGAGPLTARLMSSTWGFFRNFGRKRPTVRTLAGPAILTLGIGVWIAMLWLGWTFVFAAAEAPLVDTVDGGAVSWADRLYVAGYALFSLGNGDFAPTSAGGQAALVLGTASGLFFITLAVTYVLSVLDAVAQKRSLAAGIAGLGASGEAIVVTSWDGEKFDGVDHLLSTYVQQLNRLTTNHNAYPVLHYFHTHQPGEAPVTSIAALDEALTILRFGVRASARPSDAIIANARSSIGSYLETLQGSFVPTAERAPPPPELDSIREAGIPTCSDEAFAESVAAVERRRRRLLGLVESDAREWPGEA